jgi:uncharacterized membrane protein
MSLFWRTLTLIAAVGAATAGGVFFAFSGFVMPALKRLPAAQGIAAMQSMIVTAVRPPLMILLFGTALTSVVLGVHALFDLGDRRQQLILAAGVVYLTGCIVVTGAFHVPRNDSLARLDPDAASSVQAWHTYLSQWTAGNHIRALAGIVAGVLYVLAFFPVGAEHQDAAVPAVTHAAGRPPASDIQWTPLEPGASPTAERVRARAASASWTPR